MEKLLLQTGLKTYRWVLKGIKLPNYRKRNVAKKTIPFPSAICTGQIYPSQVASQQSLCLFQFDKAKVIKFSLKKIKRENFVCVTKKTIFVNPIQE
jgi:hypothetical protein